MTASGRSELSLTVDSIAHSTEVAAGARLVDVLRDEWGALAPKIGCGTGDCGSCTVLRNGEPIKSCLEIALNNYGAHITTLEGLAPEEGVLHPIQQAFWDAFGFQCGFCVSGMVLIAHDLLERNPTPADHDIRDAISGNLCRCTGYESIVAAITLAAERMAANSDGTPDEAIRSTPASVHPHASTRTATSFEEEDRRAAAP